MAVVITELEGRDLVRRFRLLAAGLRREAQDLERVATEIERRLKDDLEGQESQNGQDGPRRRKKPHD
jgi:hypothetical protein